MEKHFLSEKEIKGNNIVDQDGFNFNIYAEKVKKLIQLNSNNSEPITIGIYGKWGEGKTSFSNLIKYQIEHFEANDKKEYLVYNFNPWRYSTEDEILFDFFDGLKKQFYVKDKNNLQIAGEYISKYSKYLKAVKISATVGLPKILNSKIEFSPDKILEALGEDLKGEDITIELLRGKVNEAIKKANFKILIFIDDIDRLDDNEIYTLFKLVKLNANFENFIFILNFDEDQVAKALMKRSGKEVEDGKKYLEKIINIPIHLPKIEINLLERFFRNQLAIVLQNLDIKEEEYGKKDAEIQQEINSKIYFNNYNFENPRQIKRVLNSFFISAFSIKEEVNLVDLFTLEYFKITKPELYNDLKNINPSKSNDFFKTIFDNNSDSPNSFNKKIKTIIDNSDNNLLFTILDDKRINESKALRNKDYFDRYFSYHIGNNMPSYIINELLIKIRENKLDNEYFKVLFQYQDIYYKLLELFYNLKSNKVERDRFFFITVKNLNHLISNETDYYGLGDKQRIIERIASYLNETIEEDNMQIAKNIANELNVHDLCFFVRKFKEDKIYKSDLINILVKKAQNEFNENNPVFKIPGMTAKMIMIYWNKIKSSEFKIHISDSLTDLDRVKKLIRNFPMYILGSNKFGGLIERDFLFMKENFLDIELIFEKIKEFDNTIIENINLDNFPEIDEFGEYNEDDNLKQFIYCYLKLNN